MKAPELKSLFAGSDDIWAVLEKEPPKEIVFQTEGVNGLYYYIPIETLESLMDVAFGVSGWSDEGRTTITPMGDGAIISSEVTVFYGNNRKYGNASEFISDQSFIVDGEVRTVSWKKLINPSCRKVASDAKKAAIKSIAPLFGRNLNRCVSDELDSEVNVSENSEKVLPDIVILKKYEKAIKNGDTKTVEEIEKNYFINKP